MKISVLLVLSLLFVGSLSSVVGKLHLMDLSTGASCLDGSPTGFYHKEGWGSGKNKFIVYFQGGAPCLAGPNTFLALSLCYKMAQTQMGSSKEWESEIILQDMGLPSSDPSNYFHNWNFLYLRQCDGALHQGLNENPSWIYNLKFRGYKNTLVMFDYILNNLGMKDASDVLLSGISGGAKAAFYWADHLGSLLDQTKTKYVVAPDSGYMTHFNHYWLDTNIMDWSFWTMYNLVNQNAPFPNQDCIKDNQNAPYKCYFGEVVSKYVKSDTFIIQSMYDPAWIFLGLQLGNSCVNPIGYSLINCTVDQMSDINNFSDKMRFSLTRNLAETKYRRGSWIVACPGHVFSILTPFQNPDYAIPVNSNNTLHNTLVRFYEGSDENTQLIDKAHYPENYRCANVVLDYDFPDLQFGFEPINVHKHQK